MSIAEYLSPKKKKVNLYTDFHKDLRISPVSKDIALQKDETAVKDAIKNLIHQKNNFFANIFKGKYLDCGTINGYIQSSIQVFKRK